MSAEKLKSYRFATEAQWNTCLFVQTDRESLRKGEGVRPFAPYGRPATLFESRGAHAPAVTGAGEILWRDDQCTLHRVIACDNTPEKSQASGSLARAKRIVPTTRGIWVIEDSPNAIELYDAETLTRLLSFKIRDARIVDIASGVRGSVWVLIQRKDDWYAVLVNSRGREIKQIDLKGIADAKAFVFLRRTKRFVVLAGDQHQKLHWFDADGGFPLFSLQVAALHPCFKADVLGSDGNEKVFLAGADDQRVGPAYVLIVDGDGNSLGDVPLDPKHVPATGIAAGRQGLVVTSQRGLSLFRVAEVVPEGADHVQ